jgi:hypothetical protein
MKPSIKNPNGVWPGGQPRSAGNAFDAIYRYTGPSPLLGDRAFKPANSTGMDASARASRSRERMEARGVDTSVAGLRKVVDKTNNGSFRVYSRAKARGTT